MSPEAPENMLFMLVTFEVLKFERSREVSPMTFLNIDCISVTLAVLKLETSREVSPEAPKTYSSCLSQLKCQSLRDQGR